MQGHASVRTVKTMFWSQDPQDKFSTVLVVTLYCNRNLQKIIEKLKTKVTEAEQF